MLSFVSGDSGIQLRIEIYQDNNVTVQDLSGMSIKMYVRAKGSSIRLIGSDNNDYILALGDNTDGLNLKDGKATFELKPMSSVLIPGRYEAEVELTKNGEIQTIYSIINFLVRSQF